VHLFTFLPQGESLDLETMDEDPVYVSSGTGGLVQVNSGRTIRPLHTASLFYNRILLQSQNDNNGTQRVPPLRDSPATLNPQLYDDSHNIVDTISMSESHDLIQNFNKQENNPLSLFDYCLTFVAVNIKNVESLDGFPEPVGEQLFRKVISVGGMEFSDVSCFPALQLFIDAYDDVVLSELNFSGLKFTSSLIAHYCLKTVSTLSSSLRSLDLSDCDIESQDPVLGHIASMKQLKVLNLQRNKLTDESIHTLTTPNRVLQRGLTHLEVFILAGNRQVTERSLGQLCLLRSLQVVDVSATAISVRTAAAVGRRYSMTVRCEGYSSCVESRGWAAEVVSGWRSTFQRALLNKLSRQQASKARQFYSKSSALPMLAPDETKPEFLKSELVVLHRTTSNDRELSSGDVSESANGRRTSPRKRKRLEEMDRPRDCDVMNTRRDCDDILKLYL